MRRASVVVATTVVALSACAVGPDFQPPSATLPERWPVAQDDVHSVPVSDAIEEAWWIQFNDPVLTRLVERARNVNFDVRMAGLRLAQSRARLEMAVGARAPAMNISGAYMRQRQSELGSGTRLIDALGASSGGAGTDRATIIERLSDPHDVYRAGFDAGWELDLWGRISRAVESAEAASHASEADLHAAQLSLAAEVARNYFELRGVREQLRIAKNDVATSATTLELIELRAEGGVVTQLDVLSQRARLADARSRILQLQQAEVNWLSSLGLLLAQEPGALQAELAHAGPASMLPARIGVGIPAEIARRRPDIRRAEARLHAATAEIGIAVADLYPRVTLTGAFGSEALDTADLMEWGARQWAIGPSLHLPVFDGARRRAVVEIRELQQQEAAINYQRTVLGAWHEIDTALSAYRAEQQRNQQLAAAVDASREAFEIASIHYQHGLANFLVALDAQRTMLQFEQALTDSNTRIATQLVILYKALGGGWDSKS